MHVEEKQLMHLATFLKKASGMVLTPEKAYLVEARLGKVVRHHGFSDFKALMARLTAKDAQLEADVIDAMTINETSFNRDNIPFQTLRTEILPKVIARRAKEKRLNIWCAASSTGQEPYTVAMLIREHFPEVRSWSVQFVASDISDTVLDKARAGVYSQMEVNRGLHTPLLVKYFDRVGSGWQVCDEIRKAVSFRKVNLLGEWPDLNDLDIVFMRNVLIYFDVDTKKRILGRVRTRLVPEGFLMLGGAESTMNIDDNYERLDGARCSAYQVKMRGRS